MAQSLRVHAALAEEWSLVPNVCISQLTTLCDCSSKGSDGLCRYLHSDAHIHIQKHTQTHTYTHISFILKYNKI